MRSFLILLLVTVVPTVASAGAPSWRSTLNTMQRNAAAALERALTRVEATPKQRAHIRKTLAQSAGKILAIGSEGLALQDQLAAALLADEPDEAELERLEKAGVALVSRAARIGRVGVVDAARVLSPQQRKQLLRSWRTWVRPRTN